jgi:ribose-phosphate pyrophosphokinase
MNINLAHPELSDIRFKISNFPDGQQDFRILDTREIKDYKWVITSRFNSFTDLELILCATKALRRSGVKEIHLNIPYLLGARSDIQFQEGGTSYLVDIIAPIINAQNYESVRVYDVHSIAAPACINNLVVTPNFDLFINFARLNITQRKYILVSPDAGSLKKIYTLAERINLEAPQDEFDIVTCTKHRDIKTGKILSTEVPLKDYNREAGKKLDFVIVDDICDGGRTFIEIAKVIREKYPRTTANIHLVVTHGIFSQGFLEFEKLFDTIHCTNSIKDHKYKVIGYPEDYHEYNCRFYQKSII